jgi:hypothetical protein
MDLVTMLVLVAVLLGALGAGPETTVEWLPAALLLGVAGFVLWRRRASLLGRDAMIECDAEGLTVVLDGKRHRAAWREIADIDAVEVPLGAQTNDLDVSRVTIRRRTAHGAPDPWLDIPDEFDPGREALAAALRGRLAAALGLPPSEAARFVGASKWALSDRLMGIATLAIFVTVFLPLIVFILLQATGVLPEKWSGP